MNRHQFAFALSLLVMTACVSMNKNEEKGFNDALNFYGGTCNYTVGVSGSTEDEDLNGKYFELALSKSEAIAMYKDRPEMVTSTLAYRFFRHLDKEERENYSFIRGKIVMDDGNEIKHDYSIADLETVEKKMLVVENVVNLVKAKKFQSIADLLNPEDVFNYEKQNIIDGIIKYDSVFGNVTDGVELYGFKFSQADQTPVLKISAMIMRDIQNNQLQVWLNPKSTKNEILGMDYQW